MNIRASMLLRFTCDRWSGARRAVALPFCRAKRCLWPSEGHRPFLRHLRRYCAFVPLCLILSGCFVNKKPEVRLTSEPSIERALEILSGTPEGKQLMRFLQKNPVRFEYSNTPGGCHKFSLKTGRIYLSKEYKDSDALLALALARAAYIYRLYALSGLQEVISEEEEAGALFQARIGLEAGLTNRDFEQNHFAGDLQSDFCTYVMTGAKSAAIAARNAALSEEPECQHPLETLQAQRVWLEKTRKAINDDSFFQLLYDRDLQKVRKGVMPSSEAMKNDATIRAMPMYDIYRYQRSFYDTQNDILARMERLYKSALKDDEAWRRANQMTIDSAREEFSTCNLPK